MSYILGIDLGTTYSSIAYLSDVPVLVPIDGQHLIPSVVAFSAAGSLLIGEAARRQAVLNPANTVVAVKKLMGKTFAEIEPILSFFPFRIEPDENGLPLIMVGGGAYAPQEISAMLLQYLREGAEAYLGEPVQECVITVPANFDTKEKEATLEACVMAGFKPVRVVREPTAACLAFGFGRPNIDKLVLVFDLGGSSVDVSILEVGKGVFEVIATAGNNFLGGLDFDRAIADLLAERFLEQTKFDLRSDKFHWYRLMDACEKAKIELSSTNSAEVFLPYIGIDGQLVDLQLTISRHDLETSTYLLVKRCLHLCSVALMAAKKNAADIEELVLVGAATRMPFLREKVQNYFGKKAVGFIRQEEVVALGAAIQGGVLLGKIHETLLLDTIPHGLGFLSPNIPLRYIYTEKNNTDSFEEATFKEWKSRSGLSETMENGGVIVSDFMLVGPQSLIPVKRRAQFIIPENQSDLMLQIVEYKTNGPKTIMPVSFQIPQLSNKKENGFLITYDLDENSSLSISIKTDDEQLIFKIDKIQC